MSPEAAIYIIRQGLKLILMLAGPPLLTGLVVGVLISIFQAATQIQEMTLSFVPKITAVFIVIMITFPWMIKIMHRFTTDLIINLYRYVQ
ncbi:MAG: flagellar biosynthesis protein FliQ [Candidatus Poribacteria bacterium]|nr:flagellar biosynthesis protein FliQ [Candidatus Poribacteria bacterium]